MISDNAALIFVGLGFVGVTFLAVYLWIRAVNAKDDDDDYGRYGDYQ